MKNRVARGFAWALVALWMIMIFTARSGPARAEQPAETQPPEAIQTTPTPAETPTEKPSPAEPANTPTVPPAEPSSAPSAVPTDMPSSAPAEPLSTPPAAPTDFPSGAPSASPAEPPCTPAVSPSGAPIPPSEGTPTDAPPATYQVAPAEVEYVLGSPDPVTFSILPADAPFAGIDGLACGFAGGVVTVSAEALSPLSEGEHVLSFLFADGARSEARLTVAAPPVSKGQANYLIVGADEINGADIAANHSNQSRHWSWDAASCTLTLDGYSGGRIAFSGTDPLTIALAAGSTNTVAPQNGDSALYSDSGLTLTGGGVLNATGIVCKRGIAVEGGTIRLTGGERAICSQQGGIRLNGGSVTIRQTGRQGAGFSTKTETRVDGGTVTVEGAGEAFDQLSVNAGSVAIRDCQTGASRGLNATGGEITIENVAENAAGSDSDMSFSGCRLTIAGCGGHGLSTSRALKFGRDALVTIEAAKAALCAPGKGGSISVSKGADLDLTGGERAILGGKVTIGGKAYSGAHNHVVIRNGALIKKENAVTGLSIGGTAYGAAGLQRDQSGAGWAWAAETAALTLSGYNGGPVTISGGAIRLTLEGANAVGGDLSIPGAVVSGGGSLAASRILGGAGLEIRSGSVSAARLALAGELTLSGGAAALSGESGGPAVQCAGFTMAGGALTLSNGPEGIRASGSAAIRGGSIIAAGVGDFLTAGGGVTISGGTIRLDGGTGRGISGGSVTVTDGDTRIQSAGYAMSGSKISISGKPDLSLESSKQTAFHAKSVKIGGKAYAPRYPGVVIVKGRLSNEYKLLPDLIAAGQAYTMQQLNAGDVSGEGWSWSAKKNTLTLSGYRGAGIWINRPVTVALAAGTSNSGSDDYHSGSAAVFSTENLTLTGSGRWSGGVYCEGKLIIGGNISLSADAVQAGSIVLSGGRLTASGALRAEGSLAIQNSRVQAGRIEGGRVSIQKSSVATTSAGSSVDPDLKGTVGLAISDSIVFCTRFGVPGGKASLSGSPVFWRASGGGDVWTLYGSATLSRDMAVPPGRDCLVPSGMELTIAKGKRLYVYGSLRAEGTLRGAVVRRSEAGRVEILGGSEVARGRSVKLTALVVPALYGGQADQAVGWASEAPRLIRGSDGGIVTASASAKAGDAAEITCTALDGSDVSGAITMTVTEPAAKISILYQGAAVGRLRLFKGSGSAALFARVDPAGASGRVKWTSSNSAVASVDPEKGTVQLRKKGTATITCQAMDGTGVKAAVKLTIQ